MPLYDLKRSSSLEVIGDVLKKLSAGEKVYSLAVGEPVYDTPSEIIEAAGQAMKAGMTHYVSSLGIPEVRSAIVRKVSRKNHINCSEENTIFMSSKMAIYAVYMALGTGSEDEVLVPDPGYFYTEPALLAGVKPIPYFLADDYSLDLDEIKKKITSRTRAIVINTPSNPTGKVYSGSELKELLDLCASRNVKVISDEAYEDLTYGKKHVSVGSYEEQPMHVVSIFTMSKSYSMTGWRAGYIVAEPEFIGRLGKFMDHAVTCFPPFVQHASAVALDTLDQKVEEFRKDLLKKRDFTLKRLSEIPGLRANGVEGAFYMFPEYEGDLKSGEVADALLRDFNVAVLPGSAFGSRGENHLRLSYSGPMDTLAEALNRVEKFFSN